jgi:hypothetical protein
MPLLVILSVVAQAFFIIHAHKTGRRDWIWILLVVPVAGCIFYFFLEMLPEIRNSREGKRAVKNILKTLNPEMDLKQAAKELMISDNVQNKLNLAIECINQHLYEEAISLYQSSLTGIYKDDPKIMLSLAQAFFLHKDYIQTKETLDNLIKTNPDFKSQEGHLLYARTLESLNDIDKALEEYKVLISYYSGYEAKCRYGLLLKKLGRLEESNTVFQDILKLSETVPKPYRKAQKTWLDIAKQNLT